MPATATTVRLAAARPHSHNVNNISDRISKSERGCGLAFLHAGDSAGTIVLTKNNKIMGKKFWKWMEKDNTMFSAIVGETFTNAEVVYTHFGLLVFLLLIGIAGNIPLS